MQEIKTLIDAVKYFADHNACFNYMIGVKWPDGKPTCPKCDGEKIGYITSRRMLQCKNPDCRKQFSAKVGTIFEDSPLGLDKWFVAVWCIANDKNGISSCELARAIGVTQKSAWHMLHRIRTAMATKSFRKLNGEVESDETFIGGKGINMHAGKRKAKGRGAVGKAIIHGLLERNGEFRGAVIVDTTKETLVQRVKQNVEPGSNLYTDSAPSYQFSEEEYIHAAVDHAKQYVLGRVHTNGLENFWSLLKRTLGGTYVAVAPFHLFRYLAEQTFRYNRRELKDAARFFLVMRAVVGKRLTYRELTAQDFCGFMGIQ